jgi:AcrR family transcriptional regulator
VYRHYESKQQLLHEIMNATMNALIAEQELAISTAADPVARLRRMAEAHVRYHARHRLEAFVGNREIKNLAAQNRKHLLAQRRRYENGLRGVIEEGIADGSFQVGSARLASYAILDMGIGISAWYSPHGELSESQIVYEYGEFALSLVTGGKPRSAPAPAAQVAGAHHHE